MVSNRASIDMSTTLPPASHPPVSTPPVPTPSPATAPAVAPVAPAQRPPPPSREKIHRPPFVPITAFDPKIVFNFTRFGTSYIREVVGIREIVEDGQSPSWEKLARILSAEVDGVVLFDEQKDMMLFNQYICVQNQRQFSAALQWMRNIGERNIHVTIHEAKTKAVLWPK